ncbi:MAG: TatD family hydrolase [Candidatus Omnitrophica bacterium]|nr:TatD family hydrolase [Candidatus Omnitrophota bacterium]
MLIDTHCHLDFKQFDEDREEVIKRAEQAGVKYLVNVGADIRGSEESIKLAKQYENIFAAVGIHPHYAEQVASQEIQHIEALADSRKVVAIGEIGLDYFDHNNPEVLIEKVLQSKQQDVLIKFIDLAARKKLPIIFHCRNAADDLLAIISENINIENSAVVHCFAQSKEFLRKCLNKGLYASFTANITYKKADKLRELIAYAPLDRIFLETDAPYLAPQEKRGTRNEPAYITFLANEIARIKQISQEELAQVTTDNAKFFFKIS